MHQWIVVTFPEARDVLVDGTICGTTNQLMSVLLGSHTITLGGAQNYISPPMPVTVFVHHQGDADDPGLHARMRKLG
ncbi:MAG: hypothetical protein AABO58_06925 [Acidobacteriota bacterium]